MNNDWPRARERLLRQIDDDYLATAASTGLKTMSAAVRNSIAQVPRHRFVAAGDEPIAYVNQPLAIGHGQTISQPFIVALMTDLLELHGDERVLEVGTGSGYQTAVLAELVAEVFSIEIVPELAQRAEERLRALGYRNVRVRLADGNAGWPEQAPFAAIIVTAAGRVPPSLLAQLKAGGRMVIPIARADGEQVLTLATKTAQGVTMREVLPVRFVPLTGEQPPAGH
jgi:protein-L-isoaspartate(D-aspartate) O-methyltransferase